jgi:transposase
VYDVHDWHEVHALAEAGVSQTRIAEKLGMSRNTVARLLGLSEPPVYERRSAGSKLDPFRDQVSAMLDADPKVPATVILERLRADGFDGGITILKELVAELRPAFVAARAFQRTSYLPGELGQWDWWHTGLRIPVGKGADREALGLVATLPHSAAHSCVFTFAKSVAEFRPAFVGTLERLGGVPEAAVFDNDTSIVASRTGGKPRLHDEVAGLLGHLGMRAVVARPAHPQAKGSAERTIRYLETSFVPLRNFDGIDDLQAQHDRWACDVAFERQHRRIGAKVVDAWRVEQGFLRPLPKMWPNTDAHLEARVSRDGFVRVGNVDYSVPPGLAGRRIGVCVGLERVTLHVEGLQIGEHRRSYVPADVIISPEHARQLRLARQARKRLASGDVAVPEVDLARYDALTGASR